MGENMDQYYSALGKEIEKMNALLERIKQQSELQNLILFSTNPFTPMENRIAYYTAAKVTVDGLDSEKGKKLYEDLMNNYGHGNTL